MKRWMCALIALLMMSAPPACAQVEIAEHALASAADDARALAEEIGGMEPMDESGLAYQRGDSSSGAFTQIFVEEYDAGAVGVRVENMGFGDVSICGVSVGTGEDAARDALDAAEIGGSALAEVRPEYASDNEIVYECGEGKGFLALVVEDGCVASFVYQNFADAGWYY